MKISPLVYYALWVAYFLTLGCFYFGGIYFYNLLHC